jgi:beta-glucanase (GH16 family)
VSQSGTASTDPRERPTKTSRWRVALIVLVLVCVAGAVVGIELSHRSSTNAPTHKGLRLVFRSDFSGSRLNPAVWDTCYPWAENSVGCTNYNNPEYEWYLPSQDHVTHGILELVAQQRQTEGRTASGAPATYSCRSGMADTYPGFRFRYGYLQVVARLPKSTGLWSALWLGASNLKWPPEIDLIEYFGRKTNSVAVYFHPLGSIRLSAYPSVGDLSVGWHTFAVDWTPTELRWYIDGHEVLSTLQHVPHQSMYFLADLAYTSTNTAVIESGSGCNGALSIKSVEVWQPR